MIPDYDPLCLAFLNAVSLLLVAGGLGCLLLIIIGE